MKKNSVFDCSIIELNKFHHKEGNLTYVYNGVHIPFDVKRVFYIYDVPAGENRGAHAHRSCSQLLVAVSGSFDVVLDDGTNKRSVQLSRPYQGLYVPPGIWAAEQGFSSGSVCLVLASEAYSEEEYIRSYAEYIRYVKG